MGKMYSVLFNINHDIDNKKIYNDKYADVSKDNSTAIYKVLIFTISFFLLGLGSFYGQTVTVPSANTNTGSVNDPFGSYWGFERSAMIYTSAQIGGTTGNISSIGFYLNSSSTPGEVINCRIYMKMRTNLFTSNSTYATETTGATLVYGPVNIPASSFSTTGWVTIPLTTPFNYTGGTNHLEIIIETNTTGSGNEGITAKQFRYSSPGNNQHYQSWNQDTTAPTGNGSRNTNRPNVQLTFGTVAACSGTPTPGNTISSSTSVASGSTVNLSLQNSTTGSGVTYQWQSAPTSTGTWTNISGATAATYTATVTANTWYQCIVTCSGNSGTSSPVGVSLMYCTPSSTSVDGTGITNVSFGVGPTVNNTTSTETNNYGNYSAQIGALQQGTPATVAITYSTSTYDYNTVIWVDWNNDFDFSDSGETVYTGLSSTTSPNTLNAVFTVPANQSLGNYRMRIGGGDSSAPGACSTGLTYTCWEDYTIQVIAPPSCISPSSLISSVTSLTSVTISWTAPTTAPSNGYEYYVSTSATAPTAGTTATGSTNAGVTTVNLTSLTANTRYYFWVRSNCDGDGFSTWMSGGSFIILEGNNCELIQDLATLTSPYSGTTIGYSNTFTNSCLTGTGGDRIFKIDVPNGSQLFIGQSTNGYDSKHRIAYGGTCPGTTEINTGYLGNLPIQTTNASNSGCLDDDDLTHYFFNNNTGSTQTVYWTQDGFSTEEGTFTLEWILIHPSDPITITPSSATSFCGGNSVDLTASSNASYSYSWSPSTGLNTTSGATVTANPLTTTTYTVTGNNGAGMTNTQTITITITPTPTDVVISNANETVCRNSIQTLSASGGDLSGATNTVSSGTVNLSIPDNIMTTGISQVLTVSQIPANATITKIDVAFNITHTWDSDIVINLEAPNGKIVNLVSKEGGLDDDFTNTTITSDSSAPSVVGVVAPFSGTYQAELASNTDASSPTPSINTQVFSDLFTIPNGDWKLRVYDAVSGDTGTLLNCSITLTFNSSEIIWSPTTDLYTDSSCTTAYNSENLATVYAKPTVTRTYTATSTLGSCEKTDAVTFTVESAIYDGTSWSSAPAPNKEIVFNGNYSSTGNIEGCSCTVNSGNIVINSNHTLKLVNEISSNGGSLTFENNSSLIQINNVTNSGNIIYKRVSPQTVANTDYVYWSSPVSGQTVGNGYNYVWNNAAGTTGSWTSAAGQSMTAGKGVIMRGTGSRTFTGVPYNGEINVTVYRRNLAGFNDNWNLIGNPYPSAISADEFLTDLDNANIDGSIAIWTHNSPISSSNGNPFYGNYTYNYNPNDYIIYNLTGSQNGPESYHGYIPAGQAFFVKYDDNDNASPIAASSLIKFKNSMRIDADGNSYSNSQFYRNNETSNQTLEKNRIWIDIVGGSAAFSRTVVGYIETATANKDRLFDATTSVTATNTSIYSLINTDKMSIQAKGLPFSDSDVIPLGFNAAQAGSFTIAIYALDGLFVNQDVYLFDAQLNITHNIKLTPYSFTATQGENNSRFQLIFNETTLSNPDFDLENAVTLINRDQLKVISAIENIEEIKVFDLLGRTIFVKNNIDNKEFEIPITQEQAPIIIKIKLANGIYLERKTLY